MNSDDFKQYLFDTIQDVLMRVINDLENMQYDISLLENVESEEKKDDL